MKLLPVVMLALCAVANAANTQVANPPENDPAPCIHPSISGARSAASLSPEPEPDPTFYVAEYGGTQWWKTPSPVEDMADDTTGRFGAWICPTLGTSAPYTLFSSGDATSDTSFYCYYRWSRYPPSPGSARAYIGTALRIGMGEVSWFSSGDWATADPDVWRRIDVTCDGTTLRYYENGVLKQSGSVYRLTEESSWKGKTWLGDCWDSNTLFFVGIDARAGYRDGFQGKMGSIGYSGTYGDGSLLSDDLPWPVAGLCDHVWPLDSTTSQTSNDYVGTAHLQAGPTSGAEANDPAWNGPYTSYNASGPVALMVQPEHDLHWTLDLLARLVLPPVAWADAVSLPTLRPPLRWIAFPVDSMDAIRRQWPLKDLAPGIGVPMMCGKERVDAFSYWFTAEQWMLLNARFVGIRRARELPSLIRTTERDSLRAIPED